MISSAHRTVCTVVIAMSVIAVAGCKNEALPGPDSREPDFVVSVSKSANLTPNYSWGAGDAASVRVVRIEAFSDPSWIIVTENANGPVNNIASPVTHGVTPSGAQVDAANELVLEAGRTYQVTVARADGSAGFVDFICCVGP